jgi:hypothetical protein
MYMDGDGNYASVMHTVYCIMEQVSGNSIL